jgi:EAL domain-containing protein (putative c-di-GMP-specific phosphodiesterase class I)/ActR/RegA family two-component response regulator
LPHSGRLLILEDDLHVGKIMKMIAETSGLDVRLHSATSHFLSAVREWNPTHIALDLVMPDVDGVQVLKELADRHCTARIIITSGMGVRALDDAGRAGNENGLNIAGMLAKPFSAAEMRALLFDAHADTHTDAPPHHPAMDTMPPPEDAASRSAPAEAELRRALEDNEFTLEYEPRIDCRSRVLNGVEALVRWVHPTHGAVPPERFVQAIARHGLTEALNDSVLQQALSWFSGQGAGSVLVINLPARSLQDPLFLERETARCRELGVDPHQVMFELTDTNSLADASDTRDLLLRVREEGFLLSVDDFGTGYSSLLQLVQLPFSEIKIDKSFVVAVKQSNRSRLVVQSIVELGRSLGLKSSAEGVDDAETLAYLEQIGCDIAQGRAIASPMTPDTMSKCLADRGL